MPAAAFSRPAPAALHLLRAIALASAAALCAPAMAAMTPDAQATPRADKAWWAPFGDPVLDGLVARAAGSDTTQRAIVQAYIGVRTLQARAGLADRMQQAALKERAWAEEAAAQAADKADSERVIAGLAARAEQARSVQQALAIELERLELTLAALSRGEPQRLHTSLADGAGSLPQVTWTVPFSLRTGAAVDASVLPALQAGAAQVQQAGQLVEASELELRSRQLRQRAGADSAGAVLEAYQRLLADGDRLAAAPGALALAWAELLQGLPADELPRLAAQLGLRDTDPAPRAP